jgi:hypothetical protein
MSIALPGIDEPEPTIDMVRLLHAPFSTSHMLFYGIKIDQNKQCHDLLFLRYLNVPLSPSLNICSKGERARRTSMVGSEGLDILKKSS